MESRRRRRQLYGANIAACSKAAGCNPVTWGISPISDLVCGFGLCRYRGISSSTPAVGCTQKKKQSLLKTGPQVRFTDCGKDLVLKVL